MRIDGSISDSSTKTLRLILSALLTLASISLHAASIETLVMPGPVTEAHAETEETCSACHDLFDRDSQKTLCLDCHEPIAEDLAASSGFHGRQPDIASSECSICHAEHGGRDADIVGLQPSLFDHTLTDFTLSGAHAAENCASCHAEGEAFAEAPTACAACHEADDVHATLLGSECADCHDSTSWQVAEFDHSTTDFPLTGSHQDATCLGCHDDQQFEAPASECVDCHSYDDVHQGANGRACADCHDSDSWAESRFDHGESTGFVLEDAHVLLSCQNCHVDPGNYESLPDTCVGCHASDDAHLGSNGSDCAACHDQRSWENSFDHLQETGYELIGTHQTLACDGCHTDGLERPLAVECAGCHESNDPHQGTLVACDSCHGQDQWDSDQRFHHDLADFALVGLHRVASCEQCHDSLVFSPLPQSCSDCHADEDHHDTAMGSECASCHNPAGWEYWTFDHGAATDFALDGAHEDLLCASCHPPGKPAARQSRVCVACHRSDDVHKGRFGQNCNRCHLTTSFEELSHDL